MNARACRNLLLKILASVALIAWLIHQADLSEALREVSRIAPPTLGCIVLLTSFIHFVNIIRWQACLALYNKKVTLSPLTISYITSFSLGQILPGEYGGDLLRSRDAAHLSTSPISLGAASVLMSRLTSLGGAILFFIASLAWFMMASDSSPLRPILLTLASILLFALVLLVGARQLLPRWASSMKLFASPGPWQWIRSFWISLNEVHLSKRPVSTLSVLTATAFVPHVMMGLNLHLFVTGCGATLPLVTVLVISGSLTFITLVPIGLGGLGWKEGALVVLFELAGLDPTAGLAISLGPRILQVALALIGGILLYVRKAFGLDPC